MGLVSIPNNPTVPGKMTVSMDLSQEEVRSIIDKLKTISSRLQQQQQQQTPPHAAPLKPIATKSHPTQPAAAVASQITRAPTAPVAQPLAAPKPSAPPPPPPALPRPSSSLPSHPAPRPSASSIPSAPRPQGKWSLVSSTHPLDHGRDPVLGLAFCSQLDGLPSGEGHGGWLISSSKRTLNLWECYRAMPGSSDQALELMHSNTSDFQSYGLAVEPSLGIMFSSGLDLTRPTPSGAKQWAEVVGVSTVTPSLGLLAFKYRCVLPPCSIQGPDASTLKSLVVSLHSMGRTWRGCCCVSQGKRLLVYETHETWASKGDVKKPLVEWDAGVANITALVSSPANGLLVSGAADGSVKVWNARSSLGTSSVPICTLRNPNNNGPQASQAVSSIQVLSESMLITSSAGGPGFHLWDLRSTASPLKTFLPDTSPISLMKINAAGDLLATVTGRGLYVSSIGSGGAFSAFSPVTDAALPNNNNVVPQAQKGKGGQSKAQGFSPPIDVEWNQLFDCLYTSGTGGVIRAFREGRGGVV